MPAKRSECKRGKKKFEVREIVKYETRKGD
jgi:hypothetical protein